MWKIPGLETWPHWLICKAMKSPARLIRRRWESTILPEMQKNCHDVTTSNSCLPVRFIPPPKQTPSSSSLWRPSCFTKACEAFRTRRSSAAAIWKRETKKKKRSNNAFVTVNSSRTAVTYVAPYESWRTGLWIFEEQMSPAAEAASFFTPL